MFIPDVSIFPAGGLAGRVPAGDDWVGGQEGAIWSYKKSFPTTYQLLEIYLENYWKYIWKIIGNIIVKYLMELIYWKLMFGMIYWKLCDFFSWMIYDWTYFENYRLS